MKIIFFRKIEFLVLYIIKKAISLHSQNKRGTIAQLVEHRTENPCVPGSIPGGTTLKTKKTQLIINQLRFFFTSTLQRKNKGSM